MLYRISDWEKHFENNRSRDVKALRWIPVPNKHDGEGYRTIMAQHDGLTIYGAWHLILQVASKCQPRGTLVRCDGTPLSAQAIAIKAGWGKPVDIQRALDFCSSPEVGWIIAENQDIAPKIEETSGGRQDDGSLTLPPRQYITIQNSTEQDREGNGTAGNWPTITELLDSAYSIAFPNLRRPVRESYKIEESASMVSKNHQVTKEEWIELCKYIAKNIGQPGVPQSPSTLLDPDKTAQWLMTMTIPKQPAQPNGRPREKYVPKVDKMYLEKNA